MVVMFTQTSYRLAVVVLAVSWSAGCAAGMVMDTADSLPAGEASLTAGVAAGWQHKSLVEYDSPTHPEWPEWRNRQETRHFPPVPFELEWMVRWSQGLGAGFQSDVQFSFLLPAGVGAGLGLKYQLPLPEQSAWKVAAAGRGLAQTVGHESGGFGGLISTLAADPGVIVSVDVSETDALYVSPRLRWDYVHFTSWVGEAVAKSSNSRRSHSLALGWKLMPPKRNPFFVEALVFHTPRPVGDDAWRGVFGVGWQL
jgi:hypothetical protein